MHGIRVRTECEGDFKAIDVVNLSAFEGDDEAQLIAQLRSAPTYSADLSLVAEFNGRIVGHLMLTPASLKNNAGELRVLVLAPMSVVPSQSHRGIGTELVQEAIKRGQGADYKAIIVAGKPDYYARLGFESSGKWGIACNLKVPADAMLAVELEKDSLSAGGEVTYPGPFLSLY